MNTKPLGQGHRKTLEIVILDELVEIDGQHLERDEYVASEREVVFYANDILAVLTVLVS